MLMLKNSIPFTLASLFLCGCLTTPLSKEDAAKYTDLDINQFLNERFVKGNRLVSSIDSAFNSFGNLFSLGKDPLKAEKTARKSFNSEIIGKLKNSNSVIFKADFSRSSYTQLNKPYLEVRNYCEAGGGRFTSMYKDMRNFITESYESPDTVFNVGVHRSYDLYFKTEFDPTVIGMETDTFNKLQQNSQQVQTAFTHLTKNKREAERGYGYAANLGAFGRYTCHSKIGTPLWEITILAHSYLPKDPDNDLAPHQLKIVLTPKILK